MIFKALTNKWHVPWLCLCNGFDYVYEVSKGRAYITLDWHRFYNDMNAHVKELVQFKFTLHEYNTQKTHIYQAYRCQTCDRYFTRIVPNVKKHLAKDYMYI